MSTTYHPGELAVQHRMGQADIAARVARIIGAEIPQKAADFLAEQPMVVVAAADGEGRMWTSMIVGPPGFARAVDSRTLMIDRRPAANDPVSPALDGPRRIGMIALEPDSRRRMRVNGSADPIGDGLLIRTEQVYSNCPKYISRRRIEQVRDDETQRRTRRMSTLDDVQRHAIAAADTFFIGSADFAGNANASHRGGKPGVLEVLSPTRLRWPDYRGNSMFMTLGNIAVNPRCGLLIPDWRTGATLQLAGTAEIRWDERDSVPGAQCMVDFRISDVVETVNANPLRWGAAELSHANPG
jgi:predicted pyridoxine 5'-phosphate oxidase superfamily flavin-nucleotide-binding protein